MEPFYEIELARIVNKEMIYEEYNYWRFTFSGKDWVADFVSKPIGSLNQTKNQKCTEELEKLENVLSNMPIEGAYVKFFRSDEGQVFIGGFGNPDTNLWYEV